MRSDALDSAIILPSMVPSPTMIAIWPSVLPIPVSKEETIFPSGIPVTAASASETTISERKAFSLATAMSRTSPITALAAAINRKTPWESSIGDGFKRGPTRDEGENVRLVGRWHPRLCRKARR